jgi:hypothetical protein
MMQRQPDILRQKIAGNARFQPIKTSLNDAHAF